MRKNGAKEHIREEKEEKKNAVDQCKSRAKCTRGRATSSRRQAPPVLPAITSATSAPPALPDQSPKPPDGPDSTDRPSHRKGPAQTPVESEPSPFHHGPDHPKKGALVDRAKVEWTRGTGSTPDRTPQAEPGHVGANQTNAFPRARLTRRQPIQPGPPFDVPPDNTQPCFLAPTSRRETFP